MADTEQEEFNQNTQPVVVDENTINDIIRKRVYAAMGIGLVPVPLVDVPALVAVQIEMIYKLSRAYNIPFKENRIKSVISGLCTGTASVAAAPLLFSLLKAVPLIGWTTAGLSASATGGATTYALGRVFARHFANGGTCDNISVESTKNYFKEKLEEGKGFVSKMKKSKPVETEVIQA